MASTACNAGHARCFVAVLGLEPFAQHRASCVAQHRAELARERQAVTPAAGAAPAASATLVVVLVVVLVVARSATASAASLAASAVGPVGPAVGEVCAEVGADGLADPVEVDADGLEGLAVLVVADGLFTALGLVGSRLGVDVVLGDQVASGVEVDAVVPQGGVRRTAGVGEQAEEEVVGADLPVAQLAGDVRRLGDGDPGFGVESVVHGGCSLVCGSVPLASVAGVLLVNLLTADLQHVGDRLPAPSLLACVVDLGRLEAVGQRAEGPDGGQTVFRVVARGTRGEFCGVVHCVKST